MGHNIIDHNYEKILDDELRRVIFRYMEFYQKSNINIEVNARRDPDNIKITIANTRPI